MRKFQDLGYEKAMDEIWICAAHLKAGVECLVCLADGDGASTSFRNGRQLSLTYDFGELK